MTTARDVSRVEEIRERERKATEGPWHWIEGMLESGHKLQKISMFTPETILWPQNVTEPGFGLTEATAAEWWSAVLGACGERAEADAPHNSQFIAHSRADIPYLLALLADREAELAKVKSLVAPTVGDGPLWDQKIPGPTQELSKRWQLEADHDCCMRWETYDQKSFSAGYVSAKRRDWYWYEIINQSAEHVIPSLQAAIQAAREAFDSYALHSPNCPAHANGDCGCGFTAARAAISHGSGKEEA